MNLKENSVAQTLEKKLGSEWIVKRSGPGGSTISYIEGWKAIQLANEIFGYNGWNHSVVNITVDYVSIELMYRLILMGVKYLAEYPQLYELL
jgi:DNA repair and recombination protein RAD52